VSLAEDTLLIGEGTRLRFDCNAARCVSQVTNLLAARSKKRLFGRGRPDHTRSIEQVQVHVRIWHCRREREFAGDRPPPPLKKNRAQLYYIVSERWAATALKNCNNCNRAGGGVLRCCA
jgi:hypothetical protein